MSFNLETEIAQVTRAYLQINAPARKQESIRVPIVEQATASVENKAPGGGTNNEG